MQAVKSNFIGGLNQEFDTTKLGADEYPMLVNGRVRFNLIEPVRSPVEQVLPVGITKLQGIYSANNFVVVFADGKAFYKNVELDAAFIQIAGFQMSVTADVLYAALVPASTMNYSRELVSSDVGGGVNLTSAVNASPLCMLVQDGENQPWVIFPNGTTRVTQNYQQWTKANREYVPIGKNMLWNSDGILYLVSADGKRLLRSITGRPLDFMVVVDTTGDKLSEASGNADVVSWAVSYNPITALAPLAAGDGSFYVGTLTSSHVVTPIRDVTLYNEPTFRNTDLFPVGTVAPFGFTDILGDSVFISIEGLQSFNATLQLKVTGKNNVFSARISQLFDTGDSNVQLLQPSNVCCSGKYNGYIFVSAETVYGPAILVYDTIRQRFVGLDIYSGLGRPKQFATTILAGIFKLFFITTDNKIYEAFAGDSFETCSVYIGDVTSGKPNTELKVNVVNAVFNNVQENGTVFATLFEDSVATDELHQDIADSAPQESIPRGLPFGQRTNDEVRSATFNFQTESKSAYKVGVWLSWAFNAKLFSLQIDADSIVLTNSQEQNAQSYAAILAGVPSVSGFTPESGPTGTIVYLTGVNLSGVTGIKIGDVNIPTWSILTDKAIQLVIPPAAVSGKFILTKNDATSRTDNQFTIS